MISALIPASELPQFRRRILSWFGNRKRDLPWRRTSDPYRVWLSEIMLQQTRVAAVIPYYERFLTNFPDVQALARARIDRLLASWAGLGYYSRARNLRRAAKEIVSHYAGKFPHDYDAALSLPGIGRYTAAAVLSIAYGQPCAVLDGNVARVLIRLGAVRGDPLAHRMQQKLQAAAQSLLSRGAPGNWNQALMELGATVCTPRSPQCEKCPAASWCRARRLGIENELPPRRKKPQTIEVTLAAAVLLDPRGRTLLFRELGGDGVLFSRMWQFPAIETKGADAKGVLDGYLRKHFHAAINGNSFRLPAARHTVTFRKIKLEPFLILLPRLPHIRGTRLVALSRLSQLPISNATQKIAAIAVAQASASGDSSVLVVKPKG